jgi:hypothetical protein
MARAIRTAIGNLVFLKPLPPVGRMHFNQTPGPRSFPTTVNPAARELKHDKPISVVHRQHQVGVSRDRILGQNEMPHRYIFEQPDRSALIYRNQPPAHPAAASRLTGAIGAPPRYTEQPATQNNAWVTRGRASAGYCTSAGRLMARKANFLKRARVGRGDVDNPQRSAAGGHSPPHPGTSWLDRLAFRPHTHVAPSRRG